MKFKLVVDLEIHLAETCQAAAPDIVAERPPENMLGDLTINCFRLAKPLRRSPVDIARLVAGFLGGHADVDAVECVKAFVNVAVQPAAIFRDTVADAAALLGDAVVPECERRRVVLEFSAPNTNKPQHLGHVRNNSLGQATAGILQRAGHDVVPVNLVNDRGIHICKSMLAYQRWGAGLTPQAAGIKGDHFVGNYYVRFDAELRRQIADLRDSQPDLAESTDEDLFLGTEIGRAAQQMLLDWEAGDAAVRDLWQTMNGWVLEGFAETYRRMGVGFRRTYLESQTYTLGKDTIAGHLDDGTFRRREDGAVVIDLGEKLGSKVVLRSDGTSVYVTQDIGTTLLKQEDYAPDQQIWIVGDEQIFHFRVLFAILERLGCEWAANCAHMAYGMVNLPSGKMKSREGTVVDADDLFDEMARLARQATLERYPEEPDDLDERAETIGMAAVKFMLLKVNPRTTIMFDPGAAIKFEGDTGPYVLYAYARICSMLRKAGADAFADVVDWAVLGTAEEKDVALRLADYGTTMRRAAAELDTSCLAGYLLDLAKAFSRFYRECPVLAAETAALRRARLELSSRVQVVLADGLGALTIGPLESM